MVYIWDAVLDWAPWIVFCEYYYSISANGLNQDKV